MKLVLQEIRRNPLLWLLIFVPVVFVAEKLKSEAHTLLFVLSILAILPLALLLAFALALILICKAQSNLFDRARADMTDFASPVLNVVRAPLAGVNEWLGGIGHFFSVYQENNRLREEVARLRQWQNTAIVLDDRVKRYQLLLHAVPDPTLSSVMARVIGRASHPLLQTMILDAGTDQGVKPGD